MIEQNDCVVLDFTGVDVVSNSFADERIYKTKQLERSDNDVCALPDHYAVTTKGKAIATRWLILSKRSAEI